MAGAGIDHRNAGAGDYAGGAARVDVGAAAVALLGLTGLLAGCTEELGKLGVRNEDIRIATVPGALELPLALQQMALSGEYDALIALGAVIRGETYHFEIVSNESARGIMNVQLETGVPIANGVLTTEDDDQAEASERTTVFDQGVGSHNDVE